MAVLKSLPNFSTGSRTVDSRTARCGICLFAAIAMALLTGQAIRAQEYKELPVNESFSEAKLEGLTGAELRNAEKTRNDMIKEYRDNALQILKGAADVSTGQAKFDGWFQQVVIPEMTLGDPDSLRQLTERRASFFKMYFTDPSNTSSGNITFKRNAQRRLALDIALPMFSEIVTNNDAVSYAREVKINAMIVIAELNLSEGKQNDYPPVPLPEALTFMLNQFNAADTPDYLKALALIGIQRHALIDAQLKSNQVSDADRNRIKTLCVELLGDKPDDRSDDLHYWMQRKAASIAGAYGDPIAAGALAKIMADTKARTWLRCEAANAYAKLQFAAPADAKGAESAQEIGKVALKALRDEVAYLQGEKLRLAGLEMKRRETNPVAIESAVETGSNKQGAQGNLEEMMKKMGKGNEENDPKNKQMNMEEMMKKMKESGGGPKTKDKEKESKRKADQPKPMRASKFKHVANSAEELPSYKLDISRRRLKTVAMYLDAAVGADEKNGISRYCTDEASKEIAATLRKHIKNIESAAHLGVDDRYPAITLEMISTIALEADTLAGDMGIVEEKPAEVAEEVAAEEVAKPADEPVAAAVAAEKPADETPAAAKGAGKKGAGKKAADPAPAKKAAEAVDDPFGLK